MHVRVVQGHLDLLVGVLVVHVVDDVHGVDVQVRDPGDIAVKARLDLRVVERAAADDGLLRADLVAALLVAAAVERQQQELCEVAPRPEELHLLADARRGDAAGDGVVVAKAGAHQVVVLVLDAVGIDGDLGAEALEGLGQLLAPQHRQVRLGRGQERVERVEHAVAVLGDECAPVLAHAADGLGHPVGVAGEELVVLGRAQLARHAQLEHELVHELLGLLLGEDAGAQVALDVDVQERAHAAEGHGRAVLLLDGGQVRKIGPLDGLAGVGRGVGDVAAVHLRHLAQAAEEVDLPGDLLHEADVLVVHGLLAQGGEVPLLPLDQRVRAVERDAAVVADDAAAAVGVGQARDDAGVARLAHLLGVDAEDPVVVGRAVLELLLDGVGELVAVGTAGGQDHAHAAEGVDRAAERLFRLQADDELVVLVQVSGAVVEERGDVLGVDVQHAALLQLLLAQGEILFVEHLCARGRARKEARAALVGRVVALNEVAHVDPLGPCAAEKSVPTMVHGFASSSSCSGSGSSLWEYPPFARG